MCRPQFVCLLPPGLSATPEREQLVFSITLNSKFGIDNEVKKNSQVYCIFIAHLH